MQLSVLPHLTIYGDVKESDLKKPSIFEKLGLRADKKDKPPGLEKPVDNINGDKVKRIGYEEMSV